MALPLVVDEVYDWAVFAPSRIEKMLERGIVLASPTDAAKMYPELFVSRDAAKHELSADQFPATGRLLVERFFSQRAPISLPVPFTYRPEGRGQQNRRAWIASWPPPAFYRNLDELEAKLGPFALLRAEPIELQREEFERGVVVAQ
ncbi:MAG: hypothetical protein JO122_05905 [Acetobacteraceae bacterium]|nr:hypothetical protein [Acetobacteraceae bacterium]